MRSIKQIVDEIYPKLDLVLALSELNPVDTGGNFLLVNCPQCKKRDAYVYKFRPDQDRSPHILCNSSYCGFSRSIWDYYHDFKGYDDHEILEKFARLANYCMAQEDQ